MPEPSCWGPESPLRVDLSMVYSLRDRTPRDLGGDEPDGKRDTECNPRLALDDLAHVDVADSALLNKLLGGFSELFGGFDATLSGLIDLVGCLADGLTGVVCDLMGRVGTQSAVSRKFACASSAIRCVSAI